MRWFAFLAAIAPLWSSALSRRIRCIGSVAASKSVSERSCTGPSVIRVPAWIEHPLGRYYMYFAHHKGTYIRLAYADSLNGPWNIYEPGVLNVGDTIFTRPQPDPPDSSPNLYTHVASPEIFVDESTSSACHVRARHVDRRESALAGRSASAASKWTH